MHNKSLIELRTMLTKKEVSSVELTQYFLDRIEKYDGNINSMISVNAEYALEQAALVDKEGFDDLSKPFQGIPIAHKDIFCTKEGKTTCASKMLSEFSAPYDATVVKKLKAAGAICLGKTNMDEFAMGSSNESSYFGSVKNPWSLDKVPGGSSGGSAAAVAARLVPAATGTDTGGSIRQPAAFSGITGIKPTYGRVSRFGIIAFASSLDQAGIFANSAKDCASLLSSMSGHDPLDSTSIDTKSTDLTQKLDRGLKGIKIGLPTKLLADLNSDMRANIEATVARLKELGAEIIDIELNLAKYYAPTYYVLAPAEASSNLARYDGVRYTYRCDDPKNIKDLIARSRSEAFGMEVKRRIMTGTFVLSAGYYDAYYRKAQAVRNMISEEYASVLNKVDAIICPTTPTTAFGLGEKTNDPVSMYLSDIYTIGGSLAGLPALSMPTGFINNMPVGTQIIGNKLEEDLILQIAHQYQETTNWHTKMPENLT